MRAFLASNNLGGFGSKLPEMVGNNLKTLVIFNARDYKNPEERTICVEKTLANLSAVGLSPEEIDLKNYFKNSSGLKKLVRNYNPGCIFVDGGNVYLLATALHLSGIDKILHQDLSDDRYVYAG